MKTGLRAVAVAVVLFTAAASVMARDVAVGVPQKPPLAFLKDGEPQGLFVDLVQLFARQEGWSLRWHAMPAEALSGALASGSIDLALAMGFGQSTDSRISYNADSVYIDSGVVLVPEGSPFRTIADLAGRRVAVVHGSAAAEGFRNYAALSRVRCSIIDLNDFHAVRQAVASGAADAGIGSGLEERLFRDAAPVVASPIVFAPSAYHFAAAEGKNADLLAVIDQSLSTQKLDPTSAYHTYWRNWFPGSPDQSAAPPSGQLLATAVAAVIAVLVLLFAALMRLAVRRSNRALTTDLAVQSARADQLEAVFARSPIGYALFERQRVLLSNPAFARLFGHDTPDGIVGHSLIGLLPPDEQSRLSLLFARLERAPDVAQGAELRVTTESGGIRELELRLEVLPGGGDAPRILASATDISDRRHLRDVVEHNAEELRQVLAYAHLGTWSWTPSTGMTDWSEGMYHLIGADPLQPGAKADELLRNAVHPVDRHAVESFFRGFDDRRPPAPVLFRVVLPGGGARTLRLDVGLIERDTFGAPSRATGFAMDVTERQEAEERLATSLQRQENLLRELYHRTKNNMYLISSLLTLYGESSGSPELRNTFSDMVGRIQSMALVHEKLYRSGQLDSIDLADYLRDLVRLLGSSFLGADGRISLEVTAEPVFLPVDKVVPLGLVVNELVTNALKHAFPDGKSGRISVTARLSGPGLVSLTVADDGAGCQAGPDGWPLSKTGSSLGMVTSRAVVTEQLGGKMTVSTATGTGFCVTMELPTAEGAPNRSEA